MKRKFKKAIIEAFNLNGKDFYGKAALTTCQRCGKKWFYTGKATYYTSCPNCKTSVNIRKKEVV